ncbi:MAG: hypothetical protein A2365_01185 [Candidatus Nealsonbacteria bacterium RIFOXYB1_FULL_40_15]|uniref:Uncharacterized protein n=2 Tax=Candidatus Nealsoniibacteriota TaxID=1817911 RepID=A0A1G2EN07_9BACT|nr:MAG: hypothetical protein A2427_04715 [Candidatus Nealsonbacteria bacterium RIFOXYC1_FULL_40_7]OGZ26884.1 MAG: hypothetical protein A2365_01185 [Candidatus Nealsonbacteria bacterium RIFOXYB1_FULL_40_15]
MKKVILSLMLGLLILPLVAGAQALPHNPESGSIPEDSEDVFVVIESVINWLFYIILIAAVIIILWAAFVFLTAGGNADNVAKARNLILYAIVAVVVAFLAKAIILLVGRAIGVQNLNFF